MQGTVPESAFFSAPQVTVMMDTSGPQVWEPLTAPNKLAAGQAAEPSRGEGTCPRSRSLLGAKAEAVPRLTVSRAEVFPAHPTGCLQFIHDNLQHR